MSANHSVAAAAPTASVRTITPLDALERDHDWLLQGDVFTPDVIKTWITYKRERELAPVNLRPVPYEFFLYFDL